jgi:hypothetical protein
MSFLSSHFGGTATALLDQPAMNGALMCTGREVTRELIGTEAYERALGSVPMEMAAEYRRATSLTWVPLRIVEPVIMAMGGASGRDPFDLQDEVGRITVERSLRTIWRIFLRLTSTEAILSRMPVIYGKSYNRGRIVTHPPANGELLIELQDWPTAPMHILRTTRVGIETTLRAAGRSHAVVTMERSSRSASYVARGFG